jgi:hypothetical protein
MMKRRWIAPLLVAACLAAAPAAAQQRPLLTEDPEPIGTGRLLIEGGVDAALSQKYPASGLEGTLWRTPVLGVSIGLSPIAELQFDGSLFDTLQISQRHPAPLSHLLTVVGDSTHDTSDLVIATKIRMRAEGVGHPAIGIRFATKLPNASNESGLGTDTIDFYASLLIGKTVRSLRIVGNGGIGILPDPVVGNRQNDVITYGLSLARAVTNQSELVGEVNGRVSTRSAGPFPGSETSAQAAVGARYTRGALRFDGKVFGGLFEVDPRLGFSVGFTYVFNAVGTP